MDLKVNVHGAPPVPTGVDRRKRGVPVGVRHLIAAQKLLSFGIEARFGYVRIDPGRITVPDLDLGPRQRGAAATGDLRDLERQGQGYAFFNRSATGVRPDVGAV